MEEEEDYSDDYDDDDYDEEYDVDGYYYYDDDEEEMLLRQHTVRVSISVPEEEGQWGVATLCHTYPMVLQRARLSFLLSGLLVMVLALWWLILI